jgi:branched-subunit amino acid transport protein
MSWTALLVLSAGAYLFKAVGLVGLSRHEPSPRLTRIIQLLPPAMLAGLVINETFAVAGALVVLDARVAGVAAGAIAVWRKAPFVVVIVIAAAVTAAIRFVS